MDRMGHSSTRAAMVYLHSTGDRQRKIADALSDLARDELAKSRKPQRRSGASGTDLARRRVTRPGRSGRPTT
jgi:hypothetical protein